MFSHPLANVATLGALLFVIAAIGYTVEAALPQIINALRGKGGWKG